MASGIWLTNLFLFQVKTNGINAVAFPRLCWAVIEHVTEVRAAARAGNLRPLHPMRGVYVRLNRARKRRIEGGPAGARIKFGIGGEERVAACPALVCTISFFVHILSGERRFRTLFAQDPVLLRR